MLVGKKTCRLKKKCRLENFPCQKRTCPECPEFPGMQDRKTAEAGKNALGPTGGGGGGGGGNLSFGKKKRERPPVKTQARRKDLVSVFFLKKKKKKQYP